MAEEIEDVVANEEQHEENSVEKSEIQAADENIEESADSSKEITEQQLNFKRLREEKERLEQEKNELLKYIENAKASNDSEILEDDYVEGKHLKKINEKLNKFEQELAIQNKINEQIAIENELKLKFPDINDVITKDNIQKWKEIDPETVESIGFNPDYKSKLIAIYKNIKKTIYGGGSEEARMIERNMNKPKTVGASGSYDDYTPLHEISDWKKREEQKKRLLREMLESRKRC